MSLIILFHSISLKRFVSSFFCANIESVVKLLNKVLTPSDYNLLRLSSFTNLQLLVIQKTHKRTTLFQHPGL